MPRNNNSKSTTPKAPKAPASALIEADMFIGVELVSKRNTHKIFPFSSGLPLHSKDSGVKRPLMMHQIIIDAYEKDPTFDFSQLSLSCRVHVNESHEKVVELGDVVDGKSTVVLKGKRSKSKRKAKFEADMFFNIEFNRVNPKTKATEVLQLGSIKIYLDSSCKASQLIQAMLEFCVPNDLTEIINEKVDIRFTKVSTKLPAITADQSIDFLLGTI